MKNTYIIGLLVVGGIIVALSLLAGNKNTFTEIDATTVTTTASHGGVDAEADEASPPTNNAQHPVTIISEDDYVNGNPDAPITWIEYGDFDCPFCRKLHPSLEQMIEDYDGQVKWVFRHFPLPSHGEIAFTKAHAAECVGEIGGNETFWEFNDQLFEAQNTIKNESGLLGLAQDVGVNAEAYQECMDSGRHEQKIENQVDLASSVGVRGTPGAIVVDANDQAFLAGGALPYEDIQGILNDLVAEL